MLVLSRHQDEVIVIGEDITVTVVEIRGNKVKLGIVAPRGVQVHRKEIHDKIKLQESVYAKDRAAAAGDETAGAAGT
jgi:carbon storage regulator